MIVAKTKLKKIPEKCTKCKFCYMPGGYGIVDSVSSEGYKNKYPLKYCSLTGGQVPYVYNKEKRNWEYTKCKSCPLEEADLII